ncbi:hypothetical protein BP422_13075 [Brevibacillus formosus]|uniref:Phage tail tape measure protein n=1 Tax=Brevibacillus formosus TaxID=54913 RepID=A0A220MH46_9BACL|nr:hypothetical protein [Brevibacillus formosus]ASJ54406.1 hypothetical protein BP422_13075 [Brevibacillus formosus]
MSFILSAMITLRDNVTAKLQGIRREVNSLQDRMRATAQRFESFEQTAQRTMGRTASAITGVTGDMMVQRKQATKLAGSYRTLASVLTTVVAPALLLTGAGIAYLGSQYEEMANKFQARTLTPDIQMPQMERQMIDVQVSSGANYGDVGKLFSTLKNRFTVPNELMEKSANMAFSFADAWGDGGVEDATKQFTSLVAIMDRLHVSQDRAADILTLSLRKYNGDLKNATKDVLEHGAAWKQMTANGTEGALAYERMNEALNKGAMGQFGEALRNSGAALLEVYKGMQPTLERIGDYLNNMATAAKEFLREHPTVASFVGQFLLLGSAALLAVGGLSFVASYLVRLPFIMASIGSRMALMSRAVAGLPRIFAAAAPIIIRAFAGLPLAIAGFAIHFVRINPLLSGFLYASYLIQKNWDRFGPHITSIMDSFSDAIDGVVSVLRTLAGNVMPEVENSFEWFTKVSADTLLASIMHIEPLIRGIADLIQGDLQSAWDHFKYSFNLIGDDLFGEQANSINRLGAALTIAAGAWAGYRIAAGLATVAQWALNFAMSANPIGLVITAIAALIAYGYWLYENWDMLGEKLGVLRYGFLMLGGPIGIVIATCVALKDNWEILKLTAYSLYLKVREAFDNIVIHVGNAVLVIMDKARILIEYLPSKIQESFDQMRDHVAASVEAARKEIVSLQQEQKDVAFKRTIAYNAVYGKDDTDHNVMDVQAEKMAARKFKMEQTITTKKPETMAQKGKIQDTLAGIYNESKKTAKNTAKSGRDDILSRLNIEYKDLLLNNIRKMFPEPKVAGIKAKTQASGSGVAPNSEAGVRQQAGYALIAKDQANKKGNQAPTIIIQSKLADKIDGGNPDELQRVMDERDRKLVIQLKQALANR